MLSYYYHNQYVDYNHAILTITHKEQDKNIKINVWNTIKFNQWKNHE